MPTTPNAPACSRWRLYVILDRAAARGRDLAELAAAAIQGGADVLQLRDKTAPTQELMAQATRLLAVSRPAGVPLIVNDRVDVAAASGADGAHLGQDDLPLEAARRLLGPHALIGQSTHSVDQALRAASDGADYVGFGPIFPTPTKPGYPALGPSAIAPATRHVTVPIVCIGGVDRVTLPQVLSAGARCVAVVRAVCGADDPAAAARDLKRALDAHLRRHQT